jgi:hypothetical protein
VYEFSARCDSTLLRGYAVPVEGEVEIENRNVRFPGTANPILIETYRFVQRFSKLFGTKVLLRYHETQIESKVNGERRPGQ